MANGTSVDTLVIGGGQSGLTAGYFLKQANRDFLILDAERQPGDAWRNRWDSLRLFTPARFNGLAGLPFPGPKHAKPTKDEMASYLASYADAFELPLRCEARAERLSRTADGFEVLAGGVTYRASNVVVATGANYHPFVPAFAERLDPAINQLHSSQYKGPHQLRDGGVLIVGAGNSGADIAMETVQTHPTWLAGRIPGAVPFRIDSRKARVLVHVVRFVGHRVLTHGTPIGRKVIPKLASRGRPLVRVKPKDLIEAGVERTGRVAGVEGGLPVLESGERIEAANVIWATGFRHDWSWIDLPSIGPHDEPPHVRGIVEEEPGLYFVGLDMQWAATSETITGVARDAAYVVKHLAARAAAGRTPAGAGR